MMSSNIEKPQGVPISKSENDTSERINQVFQLQKSHLQAFKNSTIKERKRLLKNLKKAIFEYRTKLQDALMADFRKPATEADVSEIYPTISELKHTISHLAEWAEDEHVATPLTLIGSSSFVRFEPKGNTLIITPWNYPVYLSFSPIISAIAAGNAVVLKPSEFTPNVNKVVKNILSKVFNEKQVSVIEGDYEVSSELLSLKFDHIHFTGSPAVGKIVMKAASKHLTSVTLELGGKSPTIVDESANLKDAASKIVWGKFLNEGQTCIAPDYLLVHSKVKQAFIKEVKAVIKARFGDDLSAIKNSTNLCRIVNAKHFERIQELTHNATKNNAVIEFGGDFDASQNYISPTIVSNLREDDELMQEEIFGPIMPMLPFDNIDEVISIINTKEKPLALYIFSKTRKNIDKVLNETSSGGVCINEVLLHILNPNLPFGGVNNSGIGKSHGKWGFVDFSNEKSILKQHISFGAAKLLYPPYTKFTKFVIDFTMRYL